MGQHSSSSRGGFVPCCTSRGDDEGRPEQSIVNDTCIRRSDPSPRMRGGRDDSFEMCDGDTGGTTIAGRPKIRREDDSICSASRCGITCVEHRDSDFAAGRRAIFGARALKPTLQQLRASEVEVETLMKTITSIEGRLPKQEGQPIPLPAALEVGSLRISDIELVRRLRLNEACLKGVAERFISEAIARVMKELSISGTGSIAERPLELAEIKAHYTDILQNVKGLLEERITQLNEQKKLFSSQASEIEDAIYTCFDKMVEDESETVSSETFVSFMCDMDTGKRGFAISPQDAESLFMQMSDGNKELTCEQFKDEVTVGCLNIMQDNMKLRRTMSKQYRDTCI